MLSDVSWTWIIVYFFEFGTQVDFDCDTTYLRDIIHAITAGFCFRPGFLFCLATALSYGHLLTSKMRPTSSLPSSHVQYYSLPAESKAAPILAFCCSIFRDSVPTGVVWSKYLQSLWPTILRLLVYCAA